jgi:hypothetical protein
MTKLTLLQASELNYLVESSAKELQEKKAAVDVQLARSYKGDRDSLPFLLRTGRYLQNLIEEGDTENQSCNIYSSDLKFKKVDSWINRRNNVPINADRIEVNLTEEFLELSKDYLLKRGFIDNQGNMNGQQVNNQLEGTILTLYQTVKASSTK